MGNRSASHPQSPAVTKRVRGSAGINPGAWSPPVEVVIMTRSEFDDIRAHIAAEEGDCDNLLQLARTLLDDLEQARLREATLRARYLNLLTAARATMASHAVGEGDPLTFLRHELDKRGQLPSGDEEVSRILSDARTAEMLLGLFEDKPQGRPRTSARLRRCAGAGRRLPR